MNERVDSPSPAEHRPIEAAKAELVNLLLEARLKRHKTGETIAKRAPDAVLRLSFAQERLWFLDRLGLVGVAYNMPYALRLKGDLDAAALERSLAELLRRHESLRTRFEESDGLALQVIDAPGRFTLPKTDLSALEDSSRWSRVQQLMQAEVEYRFDLTRDQPFRVSLLRLAEQDHVLLLTQHHIVSDGWSMGILVRELSELYAAYVQGLESPLPEPALQYADYALWQREWLQGEPYERQVRYWRERLTGVPTLRLPTDRARPSVASFTGEMVPLRLPLELSTALAVLSRRENATLFMVLLAAFQAMLARLTGQLDVAVGSGIAGRTHRQTEGLIGFFVNTLVLRTDLSGDPTYRELLGRVKEVTLGA